MLSWQQNCHMLVEPHLMLILPQYKVQRILLIVVVNYKQYMFNLLAGSAPSQANISRYAPNCNNTKII